jgi:hypothetical protein
MSVDKEKLKALIAECRYGVSGKGPAIEVANDLLVDCCDNLESLLAEIERMTDSLVASTKVNSAVMVRANGLEAESEALRKDASCVDDLSALVRQLVQRLRKAAPYNDLPEKALDYLKRKGLQGSPLRTNQDDPTERAAQEIYEGWSGQEGFVPWVPGGNSLKQGEARQLARNAISDDKKTGD